MDEQLAQPLPVLHPIDVRTLRKGTVIAIETCEQALGVKRDHPSYSFRLMWLRQKIMEESLEVGAPVSCRVSKQAIVVNADDEASQYHSGLADRAAETMARNWDHLRKRVAVSALTAEAREAHDRRTAVLTQRLLAMGMLRKGTITPAPIQIE